MRILAPLMAVALLTACEHRIPLGSLTVRDEDSGPNENDGAVDEDGGVDAGSEDVCDRRGPIVEVGDGMGISCADKRAFRYAICSCTDFQSSAITAIDAFDSRDGPFTAGESGGSLGANGSVFPRELSVSGDVIVAGENGMPLMADIDIGGNLADQGQLEGPSHRARIGGDARIGGNLHLAGLTVGGSLSVSESSDVAITDGAPPYTQTAIEVTPPCDCGSALDVSALIAQAAQANDNRAIDLDPADGLRSLDSPIERTLPCGTYYVDAFYAPRPITLTITGHVALYIKGSIVAEQEGDVNFVLAPGSELDLFVENGVSTTRRFELGNAASAGRARMYVNAGSSLYFAGDTTIAGSIYAPRTGLASDGPFTVFGAVHVQQVSASAPFTVHYDRALAADDC